MNQRHALCKRAHAGLIKARASLIVADGKKFENVSLPESFWWAEGHEALEQNWDTGDFSTVMERRTRWEAFGVSFSLDGLLGMLPIENRATLAKSLSVVGKDGWLDAMQARRFAYDRAGINPNFAAIAILDACRLGFVTARAVLMRRADGGKPDNWTAGEREWDVPVWFWDHFTGPESSSQNWERGLFSGKGRAPDGLCWITLTGVFFLAESLNVLLPHPPQSALVPAPAINPGGRPRNDWWDALWCAVWGQIYRGDFTPKRQADVEKAMLDWATSNGHELSETAARSRARLLFAEYQAEGKNP